MFKWIVDLLCFFLERGIEMELQDQGVIMGSKKRFGPKYPNITVRLRGFEGKFICSFSSYSGGLFTADLKFKETYKKLRNS